MLFGDPSGRNDTAATQGERRPEGLAAQRDAFGMVPKNPVTEIAEALLAGVEPRMDFNVVLGGAAKFAG